MASADLSKELECPVCLDIYTDPVNLRCGHNFCRGCIDRVLDTQKESGGYSCPECRMKFKVRPRLQKNISLRSIAEQHVLSTQQEEVAGVCCTYCMHSAVPAVMSCLMCEASLCDKHLKVHSKAPEHVLCDPTTSFERRKCSIHKELLKYYCTEDAACICVSCRLDGEHRGHQVETLDEASEKKKKKLRKGLQRLMAETEEAEKRVQSLEERRRKAQEKAAGETERVTALFRDLRRRLEDLEKRVLSDVTREAERVCKPYDDVIKQLEVKKEELSRKMRHIEELCNMTDPLTVLQESHTGDLCDTEDRHDKQLHDGGDLDVAGISHTLHTGLSDIMSEVIEHKHTDKQAYPHSSTEDKVPVTAKLSRPRPQPIPTAQHTQVYPHSSTEDRVPITAKLSRPHPQPIPTTQHTQVYPHSSTEDKVPITAKLSRPRPQPNSTIQDTQVDPHSSTEAKVPITAELTSVLPKYVDILLNVNTAGDYLQISRNNKTALWSRKSQNHPQNAGRFQYPQVLSNQSFSSGQHYWLVDIGRSNNCKVGMCYPSMVRKGWPQSMVGSNDKSWCLDRWGHQYSVKHDSKVIRLPDKIPSDRVWICLDYEAGEISFYAQCDSIRHLHTFTAAFTEPLHAVLCVGEGCIKISGERSTLW